MRGSSAPRGAIALKSSAGCCCAIAPCARCPRVVLQAASLRNILAAARAAKPLSSHALFPFSPRKALLLFSRRYTFRLHTQFCWVVARVRKARVACPSFSVFSKAKGGTRKKGRLPILARARSFSPRSRSCAPRESSLFEKLYLLLRNH